MTSGTVELSRRRFRRSRALCAAALLASIGGLACSVRPAQAETAGRAPLEITVTGSVSRSAVREGQAEVLTARVRSNRVLKKVIVDLEVYGPGGHKVFQKWTHLTLPRADNVSVSRVYVPSGSAKRGQYVLKTGVFNRHWTHLYAWDNNAAWFRVRA